MKPSKNAQGIVLEAYVKPNLKEFQLKTEEGEIVVFCRETLVKGRVDRELMKELSRQEWRSSLGSVQDKKEYWSRTLKRRKLDKS